MNIDVKFCFLNDVLGEPFKTINYTKDSTTRKANGKKYIDPNDYSNKLYEYHAYI